MPTWLGVRNREVAGAIRAINITTSIFQGRDSPPFQESENIPTYSSEAVKENGLGTHHTTPYKFQKPRQSDELEGAQRLFLRVSSVCLFARASIRATLFGAHIWVCRLWGSLAEDLHHVLHKAFEYHSRLTLLLVMGLLYYQVPMGLGAGSGVALSYLPKLGFE